MSTARIQHALFAAFGLSPSRSAPAPAGPKRFPAIFTRPAATPAPAPFHPLRLAVGGAITTAKGSF